MSNGRRINAAHAATKSSVNWSAELLHSVFGVQWITPCWKPALHCWLLAWASCLLFTSACSRKEPAATGGEASRPVEVQERGAGAQFDFATTLPRVGGPTGYAGSKSCRACHEDQFASWHRSYHRTMTQFATAETVKANFHNVVLTNDGTRFALRQNGDEFWVHMERVLPPGLGESVPEPIDVRVGLLTGSHHMQVFWVPEGSGNAQLGFPFTWLIPEQRWVPRNSTFIRPPDLPHRTEMWNVICSRCHATGIEPRLNSEARTTDTQAGELGIACEACHGPGQRHVDARMAERDKGPPDAKTLRAEIVHPQKIEPERASQICGFCHSMKWIDRTELWTRNGFRFRPGDDLEQTTPVIRPSHIKEVPGLSAFLDRNPELLRDFFWPDGMIRVSGRDYNGLIESPCYKGGKFSCLSCHSLHESDPDDQLARNRTDNRACTQCHQSYREEKQLIAHTRHGAESSGSQCYNCHMPFTTYGVLKAIRSHQVSSPRVADELASGRPNACNLCHLDKTLGWTSDLLAQRYQQPMPKLDEASMAIAQSVRLALAGDAGQRVLIAWHLSWPAALTVSGTNWVAPVLGQLLDDPYAAVRCVAERSLRAISNLTPPGYDFVVDPRTRAPVREMVWASWQRERLALEKSGAFSHRLLVRADDLAAQHAVFDEWLMRRDDRAVRLRE